MMIKKLADSANENKIQKFSREGPKMDMLPLDLKPCQRPVDILKNYEVLILFILKQKMHVTLKAFCQKLDKLKPKSGSDK